MRQTIEFFLDAMTYERGLAPTTREAYASDLRELCTYLENRKITAWKAVTTEHLIDYLSDLRARAYAETSLLRYSAAFKTFFGWLLAEGHIPFSPTDAFVTGKRPQRLPKDLQEDILNSLIEAVDGDSPLELRDRAILEVLYGCGLRCSEVLTLNLHDVDRHAQLIRVHGKGRKERVVPFGPPAKKALTAYLNERNRFIATYRKGDLMAALSDSTSPFFLSPTGKRLNRAQIAQLVHNRIHAHLPEGTHATPHTLRHAFATHLLNHGAPLLDIRDLLGHASVTTTQLYTHVSNNELQDVFKRCFPRK